MELPLDLAEIISETSRGLGAEEGFTSLRRGMSGVVSCCVLLRGAWLRAGVLMASQSQLLYGFFKAYVKRKLYKSHFFLNYYFKLRARCCSTRGHHLNILLEVFLHSVPCSFFQKLSSLLLSWSPSGSMLITLCIYSS